MSRLHTIMSGNSTVTITVATTKRNKKKMRSIKKIGFP